jgi:hypothetical protein
MSTITGSNFEESPRPAAPGETRRSFRVLPPGDATRTLVEDFIAGVYREAYGAEVQSWTPALVSASLDGALVAAAGYRSASHPLFLERYLPDPVEAMLGRLAGRPVERRRIVEVGHFASTRPGEGRRLLVRLARHLAQAGFRWVVSTATLELRQLLCEIGLTPYALAPADPRHLEDGGRGWGSYYDHGPVVVAGDLIRGLAILERRA